MKRKHLLIWAVVGVALGLFAGAVFADDGIAIAIAYGTATGVVTGGIAAGYVAWRDRAWATWGSEVCRELESETVVHQGQARLGNSIGAEAALAVVAGPLAARVAAGGSDGWLVLTKQRLVFRARGIASKPMEVEIANIAGARRGVSTFPNTIMLKLRNSGSLEIRVQKRSVWLDKLAGEGVTVIR